MLMNTNELASSMYIRLSRTDTKRERGERGGGRGREGEGGERESV